MRIVWGPTYPIFAAVCAVLAAVAFWRSRVYLGPICFGLGECQFEILSFIVGLSLSLVAIVLGVHWALARKLTRGL